MEFPASSEYDVLVLAPIGRDAEAACEVLREGRIHAKPFKSLEALCEVLENRPVGAILLAEEGLNSENSEELKRVLDRQEKWSNLPIVLMTSHKDRIFSTEQILELFSASGSISILERPFRIVTLLASVRVALQARTRQYQVRRLIEEQKIAVQQRDDFLSIASHELKTPLTSLTIQVQMRQRYLKRGDPAVFNPEKLSAFLNMTETQVTRLSRLVDDMLDISRIVNGKLSLNCAETRLGELAREILDAFMPQFQAAGNSVDLQIKNEVSGFWDRYRIEQVIANLFSNAIKYCPGKPVLIEVCDEGEKAVLRVKDHGMGIAPENQERIFQRFERAVDSAGVSGLGLGLYISRQIVELHGGAIRLKSSLGEGSTFSIELPAKIAASENAVS